jgi:hypothetical protein
MIAVGILGGALVWLSAGVTRAIKAQNHAKLMTTATFLARLKLNQFEDDLYDKGFGEFDKEQTGTFEEKGFARFSWKIVVDKVELPGADQVQTMIGKAQDARQTAAGGGSTDSSKTSSGSSSSSDPNQSGATGLGAFGALFPVIKDVLEQGIRRITVSIFWQEGRDVMELPVTTYYTDVRRVDQAIQLSIPTGAGGAGGAGGPGPNNGTGAKCVSNADCPTGKSCTSGVCK